MRKTNGQKPRTGNGGNKQTKVCRVENTAYGTSHVPGFEGKLMQVVRDGEALLLAEDTIGCMPGDLVICVCNSTGTDEADGKTYPGNMKIVGIYEKAESKGETN